MEVTRAYFLSATKLPICVGEQYVNDGSVFSLCFVLRDDTGMMHLLRCGHAVCALSVFLLKSFSVLSLDELPKLQASVSTVDYSLLVFLR